MDPTTVSAWTHAQELALEYVRRELAPPEPIHVRLHEAVPYRIVTWWEGGGGLRVLVYNGRVQTARGEAAIAPYFAFLGERYLRAISVADVESILEALETSRPGSPDEGHPFKYGDHDRDLFPAILEEDGVRRFVMHFAEAPPKPLPRGAPPMGSRAPGPLRVYRWSVQLAPILPEVGWKLETVIERPWRTP